MKKKLISLLICLSFLVTGCGAGGTAQHTGGQGSSVDEVLQAGMAEADAEAAQATQSGQNSGNEIVVPLDSNDPALFDLGDGTAIQAAAEAQPPDPDEMKELYSSTEGVDVDITVLNSIMTYSQVFDMITNPDSYKGKVVKMDGMYVCNFPKEGEQFYCACVIMDATACCSQGIEFELDDTYAYPDDYPEYEDTVTVIGTFDTYMDGGYQYCTLRNARLL
ncbi:MAG: hypothetical protein J6U41_02450 [Lachnospiraceae bacterium]|nr:hypothetical protein [Lachnospiraceae bacterium]